MTTPAGSTPRRLNWGVIRVLAMAGVVVQHATYTVEGVRNQTGRRAPLEVGDVAPR